MPEETSIPIVGAQQCTKKTNHFHGPIHIYKHGDLTLCDRIMDDRYVIITVMSDLITCRKCKNIQNESH